MTVLTYARRCAMHRGHRVALRGALCAYLHSTVYQPVSQGAGSGAAGRAPAQADTQQPQSPHSTHRVTGTSIRPAEPVGGGAPRRAPAKHAASTQHTHKVTSTQLKAELALARRGLAGASIKPTQARQLTAL